MADNDPVTADAPPRPIDEYHAVDAARFRAEIQPRQVPAILRGLVADWPLVRAGGAEAVAAMLRAAHAPAPIGVFRGTPGSDGRLRYTDDVAGFNFALEQARLADFLAELMARARGGPALYAGSLSVPGFFPGLARDHALPGFIHGEGVLQSLWIGNATGVAAHYDQAENIACVVAGRRRFTLFAPDCLPDLYMGPMDVTPAGQPISLVETDAPDLARFPRYARAHARRQVADLGPGDALYLPALWLHRVDALAPFNVLMNFWWKSAPAWTGNPLHALMHAVLSVRPLPAAERARWRDLFDHLIFGAEEPFAHLPPAARGLHGHITPAMAAHLRASLAQILTGTPI